MLPGPSVTLGLVKVFCFLAELELELRSGTDFWLCNRAVGDGEEKVDRSLRDLDPILRKSGGDFGERAEEVGAPPAVELAPCGDEAEFIETLPFGTNSNCSRSLMFFWSPDFARDPSAFFFDLASSASCAASTSAMYRPVGARSCFCKFVRNEGMCTN